MTLAAKPLRPGDPKRKICLKGCPEMNVDDRFCLICLRADRGGSKMKRLHKQKMMACKL